ncbi:MAG TPA: ATP-binding protein [Dehalococcoidales bacterium]|jgi:heavy metal sensor kinase|nr:ATP-binding protein [Dehalococcoidales bacterium]
MNFFKSIRTRLTLWYLAVIVVLLLIFSSVAYFMLDYTLYNNLDNTLQNRANSLNTPTYVVPKSNELLMSFDANGNETQAVGGVTVDTSKLSGLIKKALAGQNTYLSAAGTENQNIRLYSTSFFNPFNGQPVVIIVGQTTTEITDVLHTFVYVIVIAMVAIIILAGIGGLFLAERALKPVQQITKTAQNIEGSDLSQRIDVKTDDELGRLASTLNEMIGRLEESFNRQRQFTADASHELRTPLAIMQAEATLALSKERSPDDYRKSLETISQESDYMSSVIGKLLFLARSDAGKEQLSFEDVELKGLITGLASNIEALAQDKGIKFVVDAKEELTVNGDKVKLRQLFINILENAVRYTPIAGQISVSLVQKDANAVVAIADTGIGIPPEHLPHIFERFYRVDKARARADGGVGLGLAIAKIIAESHKGKIEVESELGKGTTFTISLPLKGPEEPTTKI